MIALQVALAALGAGTVSFVVAPGKKPRRRAGDARLIALCDEACEIHAGSVQIEHEHEAQGLPVPHETIIWPRTAKWHELCAEITDTPAVSIEGMRAKARVMADVIALDDPMVASLVRDILGRTFS